MSSFTVTMHGYTLPLVRLSVTVTSKRKTARLSIYIVAFILIN